MRKDEATQIGILIGEVKGINDRLDGQNGHIGKMADVISGLPCTEHSIRLKMVEKAQENKILNSRLRKKLSGNLKAHILAALAGAGITGLVWFLIERLA